MIFVYVAFILFIFEGLAPIFIAQTGLSTTIYDVDTNFALYFDEIFICDDPCDHIAKLSQAKPQLQLSWLALASLNFT